MELSINHKPNLNPGQMDVVHRGWAPSSPPGFNNLCCGRDIKGTLWWETLTFSAGAVPPGCCFFTSKIRFLDQRGCLTVLSSTVWSHAGGVSEEPVSPSLRVIFYTCLMSFPYPSNSVFSCSRFTSDLEGLALDVVVLSPWWRGVALLSLIWQEELGSGGESAQAFRGGPVRAGEAALRVPHQTLSGHVGAGAAADLHLLAHAAPWAHLYPHAHLSWQPPQLCHHSSLRLAWTGTWAVPGCSS